jgi:hypothetical protein
MTLTKAEACALLHISESTMTRRLKAGRYTCTRTGTGKYDPITFSYADIGLREPPEVLVSRGPAPACPEQARPEPEPLSDSDNPDVGRNPPQIPDIATPDAFNPREYRDSFGHPITGNDKHVLFETQPSRTKSATDAHMPEGMQTSVSFAENPVDSDAYRDLIRTPGTPTVAERMAALGRSSRSLTDAEKRKFVDRAAFRAGLREGFSR